MLCRAKKSFLCSLLFNKLCLMYVKLLKLVSSFKYVPLENTTPLEVKSKCPVQLSTPPTLSQERKKSPNTHVWCT